MTQKRPLYGTVRTGPAPSVLPWQVEWVVGKEFRCHIGRIHDSDSLNLDGEYNQSRFTASQQQSIAVSQHKMSPSTLNRNVTSMERHAHSAPVRTGSSPIYVQSGRGRISAPSDVVDDTLGYAKWDESTVRSGSHDTYFILHKVRDDSDSYDQWCLSIVDDSDVTKEDIKIACFKYARGGSASRANLIQLWKSDIMPSNATTPDQMMSNFIAPPDDMNYYIASGVGGGVWFGPFTLVRPMIQVGGGTPTPAPYFELRITSDTSQWTTTNMMDDIVTGPISSRVVLTGVPPES